MEQNLQHTNNTSTAYTWKSLSADLTVLNEITPGWKGKDEDGPFHVIIEDRGSDYPYRYTLVMVWNDARGPVSYSIPGFPLSNASTLALSSSIRALRPLRACGRACLSAQTSRRASAPSRTMTMASGSSSMGSSSKAMPNTRRPNGAGSRFHTRNDPPKGAEPGVRR